MEKPEFSDGKILNRLKERKREREQTGMLCDESIPEVELDNSVVK